MCAANGISQIVWSPLAQGVLTGKYKPGQPVTEGSRFASVETAVSQDLVHSDATLEAVQRLVPIADEAGMSMPTLALAWVLRRSEVASAITGASRPEQVYANAAASGASCPTTCRPQSIRASAPSPSPNPPSPPPRRPASSTADRVLGPRRGRRPCPAHRTVATVSRRLPCSNVTADHSRPFPRRPACDAAWSGSTAGFLSVAHGRGGRGESCRVVRARLGDLVRGLPRACSRWCARGAGTPRRCRGSSCRWRRSRGRP
nr:aldo/keto reductase [Streptomyces sp. SID5464]